MDQNWYRQDLSPKPPKQQSYLWIWLLAGFVVFGGLITAVGIFVARQIPPGKGFGEWLAESTSTDNSQREEFRNSPATQRLEAARVAYSGNQLASGDITPQDIEGIRSLLQDLMPIFAENDDTAFEAKTSPLEFRDRVRQARSLSLTAMREFRSEFDEWFTMFCPFGSSTSRIELVAVTRDPADHTLIAYTWIFNSAYPERVAWYLRNNGNEMRIIDFEVLDTSALQSDQTAREFSAAFTGQFWDNYLLIHESDANSATSDEEIAAAKAEVARLSLLKFPKSIAHWAYYRLALIATGLDDKDLSLQLMAKVEDLAPLPGVFWQRATIFAELKDDAKATENLSTYSGMIGPGPDTCQLEAEIAVSRHDHDAANMAWARLLATDPGTTSVPWTFHHHMTPATGIAVADLIRSRPDSAQAAVKIATLFVTRDRGDLAEALLPIAETGAEPTPDLLALRARIARFNGDDEGYISNLEQAWKATAPDDSVRAGWLYGWANALQNRGRGQEAIAKSPDPGTTFYDLAWDEDGELILNSHQLQVLSDALQNAAANEESTQKWLKVWQRLAPVTVEFQQRDYDAVWQSLSALFADDASRDDQQIAELLDERDLTWIVQDWLAESAVQTGHATDAWDLLPEDSRMSSLFWRSEESKTAETVSAIAQRLRQDHPNHIDLIYCDAVIAKLNDDFPAALQKYLEFMKHPDLEESSFQYRAGSDVVTIAIKQTDWKPVVAELPNDVLLNSFVPMLKLEHRFDDAEAILEVVRQRGAPLAETVSTEASLLHDQKDWPALCKLCDHWLAEAKTQDSVVVSSGYGTTVMGSQFIDALLITGQLDRANEVVAQLPDAWSSPTWKLRVAVAANDQAAAEAIFVAAAADSGSLPDASELGPTEARYWSDDWKGFRIRHPMDFYDITASVSGSPNALILQSAPASLSAAELQTRLQAVEQDVIVDDLSEQLTQIERLAIAQMPPASDEQQKLAKVSVGTRRLFRITQGDISFLMVTGSDSYHVPTGDIADNANAESLESYGLSEPLKLAVDRHRGWMSLRAEISRTADADRVKTISAKFIAAMLDESASVVSVAGEATLVTPEVVAALAGGSTFSLPGTESFFPNTTEPFMDELDKHSSARLRALRKRLGEIPTGADAPGIRLLLSTPGVWQRDRMLIECPLLHSEPLAFPTTFTVDLSDSPFVAPCFRGEQARASTWSVIGWREE